MFEGWRYLLLGFIVVIFQHLSRKGFDSLFQNFVSIFRESFECIFCFNPIESVCVYIVEYPRTRRNKLNFSKTTKISESHILSENPVFDFLHSDKRQTKQNKNKNYRIHVQQTLRLTKALPYSLLTYPYTRTQKKIRFINMLPLVTNGIQDDDHHEACFLALRKSWHIARVPVPCQTAAKAKAFMGALEQKTKSVLTAATFNTLVNKNNQRLEHSQAAHQQIIIEPGPQDDLPTIAVTFTRNLPLHDRSDSVEVQLNTTALNASTEEQQNTTNWNTDAQEATTKQDEREHQIIPAPIEEMEPNAISDEEAIPILVAVQEVAFSNPSNHDTQTKISTLTPDEENANNETLFTANTAECFVPPPTMDEKMMYFIKETHSFLFTPVLMDDETFIGVLRTINTTPGKENDSISAFFHKVDVPEASRNETCSHKRKPPATTIHPVAPAMYLSSNATGMRRLKQRLAEVQTTRKMAFSQDSASPLAPTFANESDSKISYMESPPSLASSGSGNRHKTHPESRTAHRREIESTGLPVNHTALLILLVSLFVYKVRKFQTSRNQYRARAETSQLILTDDSSLIDEILVRSAFADGTVQQGSPKCREPDLQTRIVKEWSPLIPLIDPTSKHRHGCHLLIRKLTRLSTRGTSTDRLLGFIEEWMASVLQTVQLTSAVERGSSTFSMMIKDVYLFLQVKYKLPANAVITLLPFIIANASVEDLCCERRLGKMIFAAEAKLGDFFEEPLAKKHKPIPSLAFKPHASVKATKTDGASSNSRPLVLEVTDVTDRETIPSQPANSNSGFPFIKGKRMAKISPRDDKKEKVQAHKKHRRVSSPRSKEAFVCRAKYLQAVRTMRKKTQDLKSLNY